MEHLLFSNANYFISQCRSSITGRTVFALHLRWNNHAAQHCVAVRNIDWPDVETEVTASVLKEDQNTQKVK